MFGQSVTYLGFMYSYVILVLVLVHGPFWLQHSGKGHSGLQQQCPLASRCFADDAVYAVRSPLLVGTLRGPHHSSFGTLPCFAVQSNIQVATLASGVGVRDCLHN